MKPQINVAQYTSHEKITTQLQDLMQKLEEVEEEKIAMKLSRNYHATLHGS